MPDPLIKLPDKHFDILLYTANRTARSLTGLEFQPDFVWIKDRGGSQNHALFDSVRGVNIQLRSDDTGGDATASAPNESLSSFDSNGFSLGTDLGIGDVNYDLEPHVAWNWKGGGSASSNSDGSITSSVSANTTAGFSIVTFTGTGSNATVGHGLGVAPQVFFLKGRNFGDHWRVYHQGTGTSLSDSNRKASKLNTSDGFQTSTTYWNDTSPTSTTVSLGTDQSVNKNTGTFVMYCFSEVEGYSKFGKYVANELSDGPFIYTGFRPAFVILKRRDGNGWYMTDSTRCPYNKPRNYGAYFEANSTSSEMNVETVDLLSNGFKPREASGYFNHQAGSRFIYLAFAESPFKYARAR